MSIETNKYVESLMDGKKTYEYKDNYATDPRSCIFLVDYFIQKGEIPSGLIDEQGTLDYDIIKDPMILYLCKILIDPHIQARVLNSKIMELAFRDMMVRFIIDVSEKVKYNYNRSSGEQKRAEESKAWSLMQRQKGGAALLQEIDEKHRDDGFDKDFFEHLFMQSGYGDKKTWGKMCDDWKKSIQSKLREQTEEEAKAKGDSLKKAFDAKLSEIKRQTDSLGVSDFDARQAWKMMDGQWTETEFEKMLNVVRIQSRYPQIAEVCRRMGRTANDADRDVIKVSQGFTYKMEHSSGSDIEGVTMGNDINSLLPHEVVQFSDSKLEDLFYRRFVTKKLQMFRYKSEMTKPSRKLNFQHATRKGPMIICIDSSASMKGVPQKITQSLLVRVETTAEDLKRDCFIIDFSVNLRTIDLCRHFREYHLNSLGLHTQNDEYTKGLFPFLNGGTDATKMLEKTFELLDSSPIYQNSDVLWITDFLIPLPEKSQLERIQQFRHDGTRFYGFHIGSGVTNWEKYFDKIYTVEYKIPYRY